MREKWDEKRGSETYGEHTIRTAWAGSEHYQGNGADPPPKGHRANHQSNSEQPPSKNKLDAADHDLEKITQTVLGILKKENETPFLFRHVDCISRTQYADDGALTIRASNETSLRNILAKKIYWFVVKEKKSDEEGVPPKRIQVAALPPMYLCENILVEPEPPLPVLTRIVTAPFFTRDGILVSEAGYSAAAKMYYSPSSDFQVDSVPANPSIEELKQAQEGINDVLADFPFTGEAERTHATGLILEPFARELIEGPTPLHLIEKPSPGTGGGLLADIITTISLGRPAAVMTEGKDEDEWRKRITSKLIENNTVVLIDNVRRRLESAALSAVLTARVWEDRMLGRTAMVRIPVRAIWIAIGNNPALSNEIARANRKNSPDSKLDKPWLREDFKHPNLREYVAKERSKTVWCALVLIQDWLAKGAKPGKKTLGTFEQWSSVIGGIVENAGYSAFLGNLEELYEESDAEGQALRALVAAWWNKYQAKEVGIKELFEIVSSDEGNDPIDLDLGDKGERSQKIRLGKLLVRNRDRRFGDKRIVRGETQHKAQQWKLVEVGG